MASAEYWISLVDDGGCLAVTADFMYVLEAAREAEEMAHTSSYYVPQEICDAHTQKLQTNLLVHVGT